MTKHKHKHKHVVAIYTRFSLLNAAIPYKVSRIANTSEAYIAEILNPERLEARCKIFFNFSLPMLKISVEKNLDMHLLHIVHTSSLLPDYVKNRFAEAQKNMPWLRVVYYDYDAPYKETGMDDMQKMIVSEMREIGLEGESLVPVMRLDDDDLLSSNYFMLLKKYIQPTFAGMTFSAPRGFEGLFDNKNFIAFTEIDKPKFALGLAHIATFDVTKGILVSRSMLPPGNHTRVDMVAPVILDGSQFVYLRTRHLYNDSDFGMDSTTNAGLDAILKKRFVYPAKLDAVLKRFPVLRDYVDASDV